MKTLYTFLGILFALVAQAQIENRTETDCDGNSQSIYEILETGKPLIIASKGLDCSICMGQASNLAAFANNQPNIQIWGAMYYLYQDQEADCPSIDNWENSYGWSNIFSFPDLEEYWASEFGAPTYTVIDPTTTEVVYSGGSFTNASNEALGLITVGLDDPRTDPSFTLYSNGGILNIQIESPLSAMARIEVINILGQEIISEEISVKQGINTLRKLFTENSGIFIANLTLSGNTYSKKFLLRE
jgi:hypothetical protein